MKRSGKSIVLLLTVGALFHAAPAAADGGVVLNQRCEGFDSLDKGPALERDEWYMARYPGEITAAAANLLARPVTDAQAQIWFTNQLINDPIFGGTRVRPMYPTFMLSNFTDPLSYRAPVDHTGPANKPANYVWIGTCTSSCYTPDMQVLFDQAVDGEAARPAYVPILDARTKFLPRVMTLSEDSTLDGISLVGRGVASYTQSIIESQHDDIIHITTRGGGELKVTSNHPLVDAEGVMREARTFTASDGLIRSDGEIDPIADIRTESYFGRVYNVAPATNSLLGNIVVAQGFLSGSSWYQNEGASELNRQMLRAVPAEALE
jgi:hypothetical protein